jgi:hypothetical protein
MEVLSFPKGIEPEPADEGQVEKERSALDGDLGLAGEMGIGSADEDKLRQAQSYAHGRQHPAFPLLDPFHGRSPAFELFARVHWTPSLQV